MQFTISYLMRCKTAVEAASAAAAKGQFDELAKAYGDGIVLLEIRAHDYVERPCPGCAVDPMNPSGKPKPPAGPPNMGGSPATPVVRLPELVDQIAAVA